MKRTSKLPSLPPTLVTMTTVAAAATDAGSEASSDATVSFLLATLCNLIALCATQTFRPRCELKLLERGESEGDTVRGWEEERESWAYLITAHRSGILLYKCCHGDVGLIVTLTNFTHTYVLRMAGCVCVCQCCVTNERNSESGRKGLNRSEVEGVI